MIQIILSFIAGILTILAPCILLPLPIVLGSSIGNADKKRPILLVLGFITSFSLLAIGINFLVGLIGLDPNIFRNFAAVILLVFGALMIFPRVFEMFASKFQGVIGRASALGQKGSSFLLGMVIGVVWAPCAGPILGSILTLIALQEDLTKATVMIIAYSIGAGVPMLVIAYAGQAVTTKIKFFARYSKQISAFFGGIIILLGVSILLRYDTIIQAKLLDVFPSVGQGIEENLQDTIQIQSKKESQTGNLINLKNYGQAPNFVGIEKWLNSKPLNIEDLRGKVVLVDFWTYSCINCIRTLPYVTSWYEKYKDQGFEIVGVHTPEFAFEKTTSNVENAIKQHKIKFPVAQDNNFSTWSAYKNQYWPAKYIIDKDGQIVYTHFGEGKYEETENIIRYLLNQQPSEQKTTPKKINQSRTPEIYFGVSRLEFLTSEQTPATQKSVYQRPINLFPSTFGLVGEWSYGRESITGKGSIVLDFDASEVNLVVNSSQSFKAEIYIDQKKLQDIEINGPNVYKIYDTEKGGRHTLEVIIPVEAEVFSFTFG